MSFNIGPVKVEFLKPSFNKMMRDPLIRDPRKREKLIEALERFSRPISIRHPDLGGMRKGVIDFSRMKKAMELPIPSSVFK